MAWLETCDYFVRLRGESRGADREQQHAAELDIPVYAVVEVFLERALQEQDQRSRNAGSNGQGDD